jgi:hypothetical protein
MIRRTDKPADAARRATCCLTGILACLSLVLPACEPQPVADPSATLPQAGPEVWVASEMLALSETTPRTEPSGLLGDDGRTVQLLAAANETVSFQVVVDVNNTPLRDLRIEPSPLVGQDATLPPETLACFRMLPVRVETLPAWHLRLTETPPDPASVYDPLVPADAPGGGQPWNLDPGQRLAIWVDLAVPRTARPGVYEGKLTLSAGTTKHELALRLEILDILLPETRPLFALGGFDHNTLFKRFIKQDGKPYQPVYLDVDNPRVKQGLGIVRQMMRLAHEHRLDLVDKGLRPKINRDAYGKLHLQWKDVDAILTPYLTGKAFDDRVPLPAWPLPITDAWPVPTYYGGFDSPHYAKTLRTVARLSVEHFRELGAEKKLFAWPVRAEVSEQVYRRTLRLATLLREVAPNVPILTELPTAPPEATGWSHPPELADRVDILAPPAQWLQPAEARRRAWPGHPLLGVWFQPGLPPYAPSLGVLASPADVRALPWIARRYGCVGIFLPEVLNWRGEMFDHADGASARLFYPGDRAGLKGVLPSVRLKRLRRGLQDLGYLWVLRQRDRAGIADALLEAMVRYAALDAASDHYQDPRLRGWVHDGRTWSLARLMLIREVQQALHSRPLEEDGRTAERVRWQQFSQATSTLAVERVQTVMRIGPKDQALLNDSATSPGLRATILVELFNEFSKPLDVDVEITDLPTGWKALVDEYSIPNFPPRQTRQARLVIEGRSLPSVPSGKIPVALNLAAGAGIERALRANVAFLIAGRFNKPPTIDGYLDDWPLRRNNTAGDFRLLGRRGLVRRNPDGEVRTGLARRQTLVYAMQDAENLYFAFRCDEPRPEGMHFTPSNRLRWEQLLITGEDLVEILLDPGADAAGSEDLYHFVIKPNGVLIAEKGISANPPLGPHQPLPANAELAVQRGPDRWVVELRIPLRLFGKAGTEARYWGANFMRFAAQDREASSWTGAQRYFYDPRNLGTMFVAPTAKR